MPTKAYTEATETEAIRDLRRAGWPADRIIRALKISERTYYRRLAELRGEGRPAPLPLIRIHA